LNDGEVPINSPTGPNKDVIRQRLGKNGLVRPNRWRSQRMLHSSRRSQSTWESQKGAAWADVHPVAQKKEIDGHFR